MWIHRSISQRLVSAAAHFPAVLLTGARQTGKTSLLRRLFPRAAFVSLDLPSAARQAEESPEAFLAATAEPVLIDEVQYAPGIFRWLKAAIDARRHAPGRFLMTGSQKLALMERVSESLAGRCAVLELDTLSGGEILGARGRRPSVTEMLLRGGFPELWRDRRLAAREFYASYLATYLERDVRTAVRAGSLRDFERFLRACAARSGQLLNLADLARDVGIAGTTARDWLSVLEASNQVALLEPWFGNVGKRLIKAPKLYVRDTGLLCFLLGIDAPAALDASPSAGAVWETFVLGQILRARAASGSAAGVFFFRDVHGGEVDFVIEQGGRLRLVEAKWAEVVSGGRTVASLRRAAALLGDRVQPERWIACRTPHAHTIAQAPEIRLVNPTTLDTWFTPPDEPAPPRRRRRR
jgi:predicted AAA+ superfamily ATPase